jgi:hypothetical protein
MGTFIDETLPRFQISARQTRLPGRAPEDFLLDGVCVYQQLQLQDIDAAGKRQSGLGLDSRATRYNLQMSNSLS